MNSYNITFKTKNLIIPINYHYQVQSLIYTIIRNGGCSDLHDKSEGSKKFKFFTFSLLSGGKFENKKLKFKNHLYLTVRILDKDICKSFETGIKGELKFFNQKIELQQIVINKVEFNSNKYLISLKSPINVDRTVDGIRIFYSPTNPKFNEILINNFKDKYFDYYNESAGDTISLKPVGNNKKYVTLYKKPNIYITGYNGYYIIEGNPMYIEFLYYTGLGARNSCGFGCFEIVEKLV